MGGEWRTTAKDRNSRRLVIEHAERKLSRKEKMTVTMANLTLDDRGNKRRTTLSYTTGLSIDLFY